MPRRTRSRPIVGGRNSKDQRRRTRGPSDAERCATDVSAGDGEKRSSDPEQYLHAASAARSQGTGGVGAQLVRGESGATTAVPPDSDRSARSSCNRSYEQGLESHRGDNLAPDLTQNRAFRLLAWLGRRLPGPQRRSEIEAALGDWNQQWIEALSAPDPIAATRKVRRSFYWWSVRRTLPPILSGGVRWLFYRWIRSELGQD